MDYSVLVPNAICVDFAVALPRRREISFLLTALGYLLLPRRREISFSLRALGYLLLPRRRERRPINLTGNIAEVNLTRVKLNGVFQSRRFSLKNAHIGKYLVSIVNRAQPCIKA